MRAAVSGASEEPHAPPSGDALRSAALVLVVALLAGCNAPPEAADLPASPFVETLAAPLAFAPPDHVVRLPLDVSMALSERWLKPLRPLEVSVEAPASARVAWFVELDSIEPRATRVEGELYVLKSTTPDHHNTEGPRTPVTVPDLVADGRARAAAIERAGRYTLDADGARLVINAWDDAPDGAAQAFLVEDDGALRFEPPEIDVAPGSRVLLWSQASTPAEVRETRYAAFVPLDAREGTLTPIDEGLYRLLAVAVDGPARGAVSTPFLVDFERPSDRLTIGPYEGELLAPEAPIEEPRRIAFRAEHPLKSLRLSFRASSNAPASASIVVELYHEGKLLAGSSSLVASEIELTELPAGKYGIEVRGEHGAFVGYEVAGEGIYRLPMPDRLRESTR